MVYVTEDASLPAIITYLAIFVSPTSIFVKTYQRNSVGKFRADPYLAAIFNSAIWIFYSILLPHEPFYFHYFLPDIFGLIMNFTYTAIFFNFASSSKRKHILIALGVVAVLVAIIVLVTLLLVHMQHRLWALRQVGGVSMLLLSASPLTNMVRVIQTRSIKYMPFFLPLAILINGLVPLFSAFISHEHPSLVTTLQVLLGLGELILYVCYFRTTPDNDDDDDDDNDNDQNL